MDFGEHHFQAVFSEVRCPEAQKAGAHQWNPGLSLLL
jgi:hypothetical protein